MGIFAPYEPQRPQRPPDEGGGWTISSARPADAAAVAAVVADRTGNAVETHLAWAREQIEGDAAPPLLLVAAIDGRHTIAGFAACRRITPPADSPLNVTPAGWYLSDLTVHGAWRRRGIGLALTGARLEWLSKRTREVYYVANAENAASLDLHARLGFVELRRDVIVPGITFSGRGIGVLCRAEV